MRMQPLRWCSWRSITVSSQLHHISHRGVDARLAGANLVDALANQLSGACSTAALLLHRRTNQRVIAVAAIQECEEVFACARR